MAEHQHDVLSNLLTTSFRDVEFDAERIELEVGHATVVHTYPERDGGIVESLGRDPAIHTLKIPFLHSLDPDLYPNRFRKFLAAFLDGSTGVLVHPEIGEVDVKPNGKLKTAWEADKRAGCVIECTFIESTEDGEAFDRAIKRKAPYALVEQRASFAKTALLAVPNGPDSDLFDALDGAVLAMKKVMGEIDQARLSMSNIFAAFARVVSTANDIMTVCERTMDYRSYDGLIALSDLIGAAADQVKEAFGKTIIAKTIRRDMPVEGAAKFIGSSLDDFLRLNPGLAEASVVTAGTIVFAEKT